MKEKIYFIPGLMTNERLYRVLPKLESDYELLHLSIPRSTNFDEINKILFENIKMKSQSFRFFIRWLYCLLLCNKKFPF